MFHIILVLNKFHYYFTFNQQSSDNTLEPQIDLCAQQGQNYLKKKSVNQYFVNRNYSKLVHMSNLRSYFNTPLIDIISERLTLFCIE